MPKVVAKIPGARLHIYGEGNAKEELTALTRQLGLTDIVRFFEPRPVEAIAEVMSQADLGVVPKRADSFGNEAYSTKIMEFMSLGVPVAVSGTKIDRFYFNDNLVRFFESGNVDALAAALLEMLQDEPLRQRLIANALEYAARNSWDIRKDDYLELVDGLIERRPVALAAKDAEDGKSKIEVSKSKLEDGGQRTEDGEPKSKAESRNGTTGPRTTDHGTKAEGGKAEDGDRSSEIGVRTEKGEPKVVRSQRD